MVRGGCFLFNFSHRWNINTFSTMRWHVIKSTVGKHTKHPKCFSSYETQMSYRRYRDTQLHRKKCPTTSIRSVFSNTFCSLESLLSISQNRTGSTNTTNFIWMILIGKVGLINLSRAATVSHTDATCLYKRRCLLLLNNHPLLNMRGTVFFPVEITHNKSM